MPALVAGIHVLKLFNNKDVDGRDKPGHDDGWIKIRVRWYKAREAPCPRYALLPVEPGSILSPSTSVSRLLLWAAIA